jgi:hypothetical protein
VECEYGKRFLRFLKEALGFGSNLAAFGSRCLEFRFGHVKNSFPFLETAFGRFFWFVNTQFFVNAIKIYVSQVFSLLRKAV